MIDLLADLQKEVAAVIQHKLKTATKSTNNFCFGCVFHKLPCNKCLAIYQSEKLPERCPSPDMVSVIILARDEPYLNKTLLGLEETARGKIEFVVVAEGPLREPLPTLRTPLQLIEHKEIRGRRPSTNEAAALAQGVYLFHVDAHVKTDTIGWDVKLRNACTDTNTLVIPDLDKLHLDTWTCGGRRMGHKYISTKMKDEWGHTKCEREQIEETICGNGMGWFLRRDYFLALGGCDERFAPVWGSFGLEWALKVWLSDPDGRGAGRVLLHGGVIFAHWWKGPLPYKTPGVDETRTLLWEWYRGEGKNQVRPYSFLYERLPHLWPTTKRAQRFPLIAQKPVVTVIMNTNGLYPDLIEEAIESFVRQDYPYAQLLIVNTNPHKLTLHKEYKNISIQNIPSPETFPDQIAYAIKQVTTPYWTIMDSDDIFFSFHLSQLVSHLPAPEERPSEPHYVMLQGAFEQQQPGGEITRRHRGWWCGLYSRLPVALVDTTLQNFKRKSKKNNGFDLYLIKRSWWKTMPFEGRLSVLHRLNVAFHIGSAHKNPAHFSEGAKRALLEPPPVLRPQWKKDYELEQFAEPITMILTTFRRNDVLLGEAIESFRRQTYKNKKLLIVNTNPNKLVVEDPQICIYNTDDFPNYTDQVRFAIDKVDTDLFCIMDDDDICLPEHISSLYALFLSVGRRNVVKQKSYKNRVLKKDHRILWINALFSKKQTDLSVLGTDLQAFDKRLVASCIVNKVTRATYLFRRQPEIIHMSGSGSNTHEEKLARIIAAKEVAYNLQLPSIPEIRWLSEYGEVREDKTAHFLLTRYNVGVYSRGWSEEEINAWMEYRIKLFYQYTYPSICAQSSKDFTWLVFVDAATPERFLSQLRLPQIELVSVSGDIRFEEMPEEAANMHLLRSAACDAIRKRLRGDETLIITSRCDSDDCLHRTFIERVRSCGLAPKEICIFPSVFIQSKQKELFYWRLEKNQFVSLAETPEKLHTVWCRAHSKMIKYHPSKKIEDIPGGMWILHENNLSFIRWHNVHPITKKLKPIPPMLWSMIYDSLGVPVNAR